MLCCVGLFGGLAVGQSLGGAWTVIAPAAGFGIGLAADMKLMKGMNKSKNEHDTGVAAKEDAREVCAVAADDRKTEARLEHMGKT